MWIFVYEDKTLTAHLKWEGQINEMIRTDILDHPLGQWLTEHKAKYHLECQVINSISDYQLVVYVTLYDDTISNAFYLTWC